MFRNDLLPRSRTSNSCLPPDGTIWMQNYRTGRSAPRRNQQKSLCPICPMSHGWDSWDTVPRVPPLGHGTPGTKTFLPTKINPAIPIFPDQQSSLVTPQSKRIRIRPSHRPVTLHQHSTIPLSHLLRRMGRDPLCHFTMPYISVVT